VRPFWRKGVDDVVRRVLGVMIMITIMCVCVCVRVCGPLLPTSRTTSNDESGRLDWRISVAGWCWQ